MEDEYKAILEFANELGLHFNEEIVDKMYRLLNSGMGPDNLSRLLKEIRRELSKNGVI